jgi:hypothetical protein
MFIPLALIQDARPAVVATLPATNLLAEDLAFDAASGRWFVSSVHRREILVKAPGRPWRVFVSRGLSGVLALGLNAPRRCLWATSVGLPQASDLMAVDRDRSALVAFDADSGRELRRIPLEGQGHALGDMAVAGDGTVFVTDSRGGGVYRLDPGGKALASLVAPGTFRSPQTPVVVEGGILVPDYAKGLAFVPASGGAARWLEFPAGADLRGLDGMALAGHRLYAVQNGASPNRVLALDLDAGFAKVERVTVLMEVSEATHVLLHGGALFLLADNGWDRFGPDGALVKDLPPETPPRILKLPLP